MSHLLGYVSVGVLTVTVAVGAQTPPQQPPPTQRPTMRTAPAQDQSKVVTVEGCLMREADVPGRKPNVTERAGIGEDYILTTTKMVKGSEPRTVTAPTKPGDTATSSSRGAAAMYEVEGISDDDLKPYLGRRVQIDGAFENLGSPQVTPEGQGSANALVQIRGTMIRPAVGNCAAK